MKLLYEDLIYNSFIDEKNRSVLQSSPVYYGLDVSKFISDHPTKAVDILTSHPSIVPKHQSIWVEYPSYDINAKKLYTEGFLVLRNGTNN